MLSLQTLLTLLHQTSYFKKDGNSKNLNLKFYLDIFKQHAWYRYGFDDQTAGMEKDKKKFTSKDLAKTILPKIGE